MSKMLKVLKKVNTIRENKYTIALGNGVDEFDHSFSNNGQPEPSVISHPKASSENHAHAIPLKDNLNFNLILIFLIVFVGLTSVLMSFKIASELSSTKSLSASLKNELKKQNEKINELGKKVVQLESHESILLESFDEKLGKVNDRIKDYQENMLVVVEENNKLRKGLEDLKFSHQSLLNKHIELNSELKQLKKHQQLLWAGAENDKVLK